MPKESHIEPIIIIGAPRSGTNILRDVLTRLPNTTTWPCDEINYIWRHGNAAQDTDEFGPELARSDVKRFIQGSFKSVATRNKVSKVVEKTCANSLRVDFVEQIFPNAQYVYIIRDGRDAIASAMKRWRAPLNLPYILKKARFVPITDMPYYSGRYLWNRIYRMTKGEGRLAVWGPRFNGMESAVNNYPLAGVCAIQWSRCVEKADSAIIHFDETRVQTVSYENFVTQPVKEIGRLASFIGIEISSAMAKNIVADVSPASIGKWAKSLGQADLDLIEEIAGTTLANHGYQ